MNIDILDLKFELFKKIIEENDGKFFSFESQPFIAKNESYKYRIHTSANEALNTSSWKNSDIGTGRILERIKAAINVRDNNLLIHDNRRGIKARPDKSLYLNLSKSVLTGYETALFEFYFDKVSDEISFNHLVKIAGSQYPFIVFLFFLKSRKKYLPIAPNTFDKIFKSLGIDLVTTKRCSWENYNKYLDAIGSIQDYLQERIEFNEEISLLDAHSFLWIIGRFLGDATSQISEGLKNIKFTILKPNRREINIGEIPSSSFSRDVDFERDNNRKRGIGIISENIVLNYLKANHTTFKDVTKMIGLGYDFEVLDKSGNVQMRIEVKTESINKSFIISENEVRKSQEFNNYHIYVVRGGSSNSVEILSIKVSDILKELNCLPIGYRVYF